MRKKRIPPYTKKIFSILILIATVTMSIGYASINSIIMNISGEVVAKAQDGIYITEVSYVERTNSLPNEEYSISYADNTILKSSINLEPNDLTSEVSLKISFYNNTENDYIFSNISYDEGLINEMSDIYSNSDIDFSFDNQNSIISKNGGSLDVVITFKYNEISENTSNTLNSILKFEFKKIFGIVYNDFANTSGLPIYAIENDTLEIDMSSQPYYYFAIFMADKKLVLNEDYTFNNRIINIPNVDGDLSISTFGAVTDGLITLSNPYINTSNMYGDFKILDEDADLSNSYGTCSYYECYSDNNGLYEYDENGALMLDNDNQIGLLVIDDSMKINEEYTAYITLRADVNQLEPNGKFATAAIAISENGPPYLLWLGFYDGYMHVYSYSSKNEIFGNSEYTRDGFISIKAEKFSNKTINIQIVGCRGNQTKIYINGELLSVFNSEDIEVNYVQATLGDLRPGRGLKFEGTIYDVALYNRALTEEEIEINWNYANEVWKIE